MLPSSPLFPVKSLQRVVIGSGPQMLSLWRSSQYFSIQACSGFAISYSAILQTYRLMILVNLLPGECIDSLHHRLALLSSKRFVEVRASFSPRLSRIILAEICSSQAAKEKGDATVKCWTVCHADSTSSSAIAVSPVRPVVVIGGKISAVNIRLRYHCSRIHILD